MMCTSQVLCKDSWEEEEEEGGRCGHVCVEGCQTLDQ